MLRKGMFLEYRDMSGTVTSGNAGMTNTSQLSASIFTDQSFYGLKIIITYIYIHICIHIYTYMQV